MIVEEGADSYVALSQNVWHNMFSKPQRRIPNLSRFCHKSRHSDCLGTKEIGKTAIHGCKKVIDCGFLRREYGFI